MPQPSLKRSLSLRSSILVVFSACLLIGAVELQALRAKEPHVKPASTLSAVACIQCHSDPQSIRRMWEKEDGAHFLFNPDGTFKASRLSEVGAAHPGREAVEKALKDWNAAPRIGASVKPLRSQEIRSPGNSNSGTKGKNDVN